MSLDAPEARTRHTGLLIYGTLCASVAGLLLLTNWPAYQYEIRGGLPAVWYYAFAGALIVPILFAEPVSALRFMKAPLFWWFAAYVLSALLWLLASQDFIEYASRVWRFRLLLFMFYCTVVILAFHANRPLVALLIIGCVFLASSFSWFDVMRPYRFVPRGIDGSNPGRGTGMFMHANSAAIVVAGKNNRASSTISQMIESGKAHRGQLAARARQRVIDNCALEAVVRRYENLYTQVNDEYSSKRRT